MQLCIMDVQFGWKLSLTYFFLFSDIIKKSVRMASTYFVDRLIEKFIKNSSFEHTSDG